MSWPVRAWFGVVAAALWALPAGAADPAFVGVLALAADDAIADELNLDDGLRARLAELIDRHETAALDVALEVKGLSAAEQRQKLAPLVAKAEAEGLALLTAAQRTRLMQLRVERAGLTGLADGAVAETVGLTAAQRTQVEAILARRDAAMTVGGEEQRRIARAQFERELAGVLTPAQRQQWEQLAGLIDADDHPAAAAVVSADDLDDFDAPAASEPAEPAESVEPADSPAPTEPADPSDPAEPVEPVEPKEADDAPVEPATPTPTPTPSDRPTPPATTTPSERPSPGGFQRPGGSRFGGTPSSGAPSSTPGRTESAPRAPGAPLPSSAGDDGPRPPLLVPPFPAERTADGEVRLRFNFRFAPWRDVLDWFAQQADLSLVLDIYPTGTFNYTDNRSYTPAEAIDLLNSVLLTKGYTLVRRDRMLILVNLDDGVPPNLVSRVTAADLDKRGEFELVSCLFRVTKLKPEEVEAEIRRLLGPQGSIVVLPQSQQVFVTETAGKLRIIRDVIDSIENPLVDRDARLQAFKLEHATVDEALVVLRQLLGIPGEQLATPDGTLRLAIDQIGGRLIARGKEDVLTRVEEILKQVDIPFAAAGGAGIIEQPQLEVYPVGASDPQAVLQVVQTLLAGAADVRLTIDPGTSNLVALARPSEHATIRATLSQLERDGKQIDVMVLRRVDPQLAVLAINKLFGSGDDKNPSTTAPKVDADPYTGQLLVRGTAGQIAQIKGLLEKMGEDPAGADGELYAEERGPVRVIPLTGHSAEMALAQLETIWPTVRTNRIRTVTPSASSSAVRTRERPPAGLPEQPAAPSGLEGLDLFERLRRSLEDLPSTAPGSLRQPPPGVQPPAQPLRPEATQPLRPEAAPVRPDVLLDDPTTRRSSGVRFQLAHFQEEGSAPSPAAPSPAAPRAPAATETPAAPPRPAGAPPEIIVSVGPNGIVIASDDLEALDEFEDLLRLLADRSANSGRQYTVFYLRFADVQTATELLQELLGSGGGGGSDDGGGGGLFGSLASAALGDVGGGLLGGLLGGLGGGGGGSSFTTSGSVSIVPDHRLNAIVVQANPTDLDMIEQLLEVIDQESSPENVQTTAPPRLIPVFNTNAAEIAQVVQQAFPGRIAGAGGGQQRQPSPEDFIRALSGGRGGGGGNRGNSRRDAAREQQQIAIGVDTRSNSLIVSAPDPLFGQVKALIEQLDQAAIEEAQDAVRVVSLRRANPQLVQQALSSIVGQQVRTGTTTGDASRTASGGDTGRRDTGDDQARDAARRQAEFFNALQRGVEASGGRGGFGGGGPPGGFGGGRTGGSRGGR